MSIARLEDTSQALTFLIATLVNHRSRRPTLSYVACLVWYVCLVANQWQHVDLSPAGWPFVRSAVNAVTRSGVYRLALRQPYTWRNRAVSLKYDIFNPTVLHSLP